MTSAATGASTPDGKGLAFVLDINASIFRSWYWFNAHEPQESNSTPTRGATTPVDTEPDAKKNPVAAEADTIIEIQNLHSAINFFINRKNQLRFISSGFSDM